MGNRRALRILLPLTLSAAALFAACGTDVPADGVDGGAQPDGETPDQRTDSPRPPDSEVPDTSRPDSAPTDAPTDAPADTSDGAPAPVRAPFGLDTRPANPTCVAPARPTPSGNGVRFTEVFAGAGLRQPMVLAQIPGDRTRFFAAELAGTIVSFSANNPTSKTVVGTVPGQVYTDGECGLLGMAFHPRFATNGYVYLTYNRIRPADLQLESVIIRMQSADNGLTFTNPVTILGPFIEPADNHKGGDLHFGPDGYLYASFGDGGGAGDTFGNGQRKDSFFSKILRIDVDSAFPYAIPDGNPFKAGGGEPATFAYGFRNPYRFTVDPVSGSVWTADVGQDNWEEVDEVVAGGNYGWSVREGAHCHPAGSACSSAGFIDPYWEHDRTLGVCIIGGPIYRGAKMPDLLGKYLAADCSFGWLFNVTPDPATGIPAETILNPAGPAEFWIGFSEDNDRELYLITFGSKVYALDQAPGTVAPPFPDKLSKTGCFDATDPKKPLPALLPFAPNSPFWSDGAEKERYFAIPDGTKITVAANGDFDFPNGTVLAKHFRVDGRLVETRLFVRHTDGEWGGYTYEWNDALTDATLLPANKTRALPGGKSWYYPSRGECLGCHTAAAGRSLGLEIGQLNFEFVYTSTNRLSNQLATLDRLGLFTTPLAAPSTLPVIPSPTGTAPLEARARSYLHSNCSHCHRPTGPGRSNMDLRFERTFAQTSSCNAVPTAGDLGVAGARLLVPGSPLTSLVSLRLRSPGPGRMPPIATRRTDTTGAQLVDDWIRSVTACPP